MTSVVIYLDESGDLGWKFDAPYNQGGSSRFLTIAALLVPNEKKHLPKRVVRGLYTQYKWNTSTEKKWADMSPAGRVRFSEESAKLAKAHPDIQYITITVRKENVLEHIRRDPNKLYNYMIKLALIEEMAKYPLVTLVPDPRTIKVESGNSLHDYLQTELWFTKNSGTTLSTNPSDSKKSLSVQFVDMLAGVVQSYFEHRETEPFRALAGILKSRTLYF